MAEDTPIATSENTAEFTELFEVQVNPASFQEGLAELKRIYDQWVADLGDNATGVLGAGVAGSLKEADAAAKGFSDSVSKSLSTLAEQINGVATALESRFGKAMDAAASRVDSTVQRSQDALQSMDEAKRRADVKNDEISSSTTRRGRVNFDNPDEEAEVIDRAADRSRRASERQQDRKALAEAYSSINHNAIAERLTPGQRDAHNRDLEFQGQLDASITKRIDALAKLDTEESKWNAKSITGLQEQSSEFSRINQEITDLREKIASLPKPNLPQFLSRQQLASDDAASFRPIVTQNSEGKPTEYKVPEPTEHVTKPEPSSEDELAKADELIQAKTTLLELEKQASALGRAVAAGEERKEALLAKQIAFLDKIAEAREKIAASALKDDPKSQRDLLESQLASNRARYNELESVFSSINTGTTATADDLNTALAVSKEQSQLEERRFKLESQIIAAKKSEEEQNRRLLESEERFAKQDISFQSSKHSGNSVEDRLKVLMEAEEAARLQFEKDKAEMERINAPQSTGSALEREAANNRASASYKEYQKALQETSRLRQEQDKETERAARLQDAFYEKLRVTAELKERLGFKTANSSFAQQVDTWKRKVQELEEELRRLESNGIPKDGAVPTQEGLGALEQYESILKRLRRAQENLTAATKNNEKAQRSLLGVVAEHMGRALRIAVEYTLAYRAINLIVDGIGELVAAPVKAFEQGIKYLEDMEQRVDRIGAAINATTFYSSNLTEQLHQSAKAAENVAVLLQHFGAQHGLDPKQLTDAYVQLKEAGAGSLVHNEAETVQLAEQLSLVTKVAKTEQQRQSMAEEIPRLMQGQVTGVNHVLQSLGITNTRWNEIVSHSRTYHDLLQQLAPYLEQYNQYLETTKDHHEALTSSIKTSLSEIAGAFAKPVYAEFESLMRKIRDWLVEHKETLTAIAELFGQGLASVTRIGEGLIDIGATILGLRDNTSGWKDDLKAALSIVGSLVIDLEHLVATASNLAKYLHHDSSKDIQPGDLVQAPEDREFNLRTAQEPFMQRTVDRLKHQYKPRVPFVGPTTEEQTPFTWRDVMERQKQIDADRQHRSDDLAAILSGKPVPGEKTDSQRATELANNGKNTRNTAEQKPDAVPALTSEFRSDESRYRYYVDQAKKTADDLRQTALDAARLSKISYQEAATQIAAINAEELKKLSELSNELFSKAVSLRKSIETAPGLTPEKRKAALSSFDSNVVNVAREYANTQAAITKLGKQADTQAAQETERKAQEKSKTEIAIARDQLRAKQELNRQLLSEGRLLHSQELQDDKTALDREHALQQQEFEQQRSGKSPQSAEYAASLDAQHRADEAYASQRELLERRITETLRQEEVARQQFHLQLLAARLAGDQRAHELASSVSVYPSFGADDQRLIERTKQLIDLQYQEAAAEYAVAAARKSDTAETQALALKLESLHQSRIAAMQQEIEQRTRDVRDPVFRRIITQQTIQSNVEQTQDKLNKTQGELDKLGPLPPQGIFLDANPELKQKVIDLTTRIAELTQTLKEQKQVQHDSVPTKQSIFHNITDGLFGPGAVDSILGRPETNPDGSPKLDENGNPIRKKPTLDQRSRGIAEAGMNAASVVGGEVSNYKEGSEKTGNAMGGIGNLLSKGFVSDVLSAIPVVGAFVKPVGELLNFIGAAFHNAAIKIAQQIKDEFDKTQQQISNGTLGPQAGTNAIQVQMQDAIKRLDGKFGGGSDLLAKILPDMESELQQLVAIQQQTLVNFEYQLNNMQLQSDTLGQINSQWQQVNQQVAQYLDAGGSAVQATQMLNLALQQIQRSAGAELTQGYDQAVKDALQLNQLTQQRYNLEQQFKHQQFDLINADSIERMQAGAVTRGQQLEQLRTQYQQQMDDLNAQVSLESQKVSAEGKVFQLAQSISDLHRQDEALTLASLNLQLQKYKDMQNAVAAISQGQGTPGAGDTGLANNLKAIDQQVVNYANALKNDTVKNKQGDSANNTKTLMGFLQMAQTQAQQLAASAGGTLVGTGTEGDFLQAIEAATSALQQQGTFAAAHPDTDTGGWAGNVAGYLGTLNDQISQLTRTKDQLMTTSPQIGFNPANYTAPQIDLSGLKSTLNAGFGTSQTNTININVNIPAGTATAQIGATIADSVTQELQRQFRQGIN